MCFLRHFFLRHICLLLQRFKLSTVYTFYILLPQDNQTVFLNLYWSMYGTVQYRHRVNYVIIHCEHTEDVCNVFMRAGFFIKGVPVSQSFTESESRVCKTIILLLAVCMWNVIYHFGRGEGREYYWTKKKDEDGNGANHIVVSFALCIPSQKQFGLLKLEKWDGMNARNQICLQRVGWKVWDGTQLESGNGDENKTTKEIWDKRNSPMRGNFVRNYVFRGSHKSQR